MLIKVRKMLILALNLTFRFKIGLYLNLFSNFSVKSRLVYKATMNKTMGFMNWENQMNLRCDTHV